MSAAAKRIIAGPDDFAAVFGVSRETCERLIRYEALLKRWQEAQNLVAPSTLGEIWHRHFADSAQLLALARGARHWLDLGSGGGFPGMVIAILLIDTPGAQVDLVESNGRKCAFLDTVRRETGARARVHHMRVHEAYDRVHGPFDVITARALAPLAGLLDLAAPFFSAHTQALFLKGQDVGSELTEAARYWKIAHKLHRSLTDPDGRILMVNSLERRQASEQ